MDGRKNNKGTKGNKGGRPKRMDEEKMLGMMDAVTQPKNYWVKLWERCEDGDTNALKLWGAYRFGQPTKSIELSSKQGGEPIVVNILSSDGKPV